MQRDSDVDKIINLIMKDWKMSQDEIDLIILTNNHSFEGILKYCSNNQLRRISNSLISIIINLHKMMIQMMENLENQESLMKQKLKEQISKLEKELQ